MCGTQTLRDSAPLQILLGLNVCQDPAEGFADVFPRITSLCHVEQHGEATWKSTGRRRPEKFGAL